ncbi:class I SAM-dependent methyltransferase [Cyanobium sp. AMD-g]|uniref:class I SAM-dependent methyltransferase n=1 Tax=Cyanobium sp. AMD-g TaxID=2823699 RepID=UPI0020CCB834|nr:class I SAM-dependent methyltransferase [Cyanobium sp. AMD-g]MCP9929230.1 class I SAM-dependent methyltransferase [Cyanobium sp. AMD-g]
MNRQSYNAIVKDWDSARESLLPYEVPFLERLTQQLPKPAKVLDLGCGTGRPVAEFLLQKGMAVTGIDQAENLLALAKERFPAGRWRQAEMETFEPDETYDGAVIWDSLFHIPREHHEPILSRVLGSLRQGSRLILTVGGSDHPPFTDTMFGQTFFYDSHAPSAVITILKSLDASIEHAEFINPPTRGRDKGRYGIVAIARTALADRSSECMDGTMADSFSRTP